MESGRRSVFIQSGDSERFRPPFLRDSQFVAGEIVTHRSPPSLFSGSDQIPCFSRPMSMRAPFRSWNSAEHLYPVYPAHKAVATRVALIATVARSRLTYRRRCTGALCRHSAGAAKTQFSDPEITDGHHTMRHIGTICGVHNRTHKYAARQSFPSRRGCRSELAAVGDLNRC